MSKPQQTGRSNSPHQAQSHRNYRKPKGLAAHRRKAAATGRPFAQDLENLENRRLMSSTSLANGVLNIQGDANSPNVVIVREIGSSLMVLNDTNFDAYSMSQVKSISVTTGTQVDHVLLNANIATPISVIEGNAQDVVTGQSSTTTVQPPSTSSNSGSNTGSGSTSTSPQAVITVVDGQNILAGQAVQVNGLNSTLGSGDYLSDTYTWNFGDPNGQYNVLTGYNAAHLFTAAGIYNVTLTVTNNLGQSSTASTQVTVSADTRKIIYVSNQGNDSNTGASPSQAVQTLAQAASMMTSNTRILLEAGETFDLSSQISVSGLTNVTFSSYGAGANPIIMWNGARDMATEFSTSANSSRIGIENITFDSIYTGDTSESGMPFAIQPGGTNIVVYNDEFLNVGYGINGNPSPNGILVQDCNCPDQAALRGYFIYETGTNWTILGNTVAGSEDEHDIRGTGSDINVEYNTLTNPSPTDQTQAKNDLNFQGGSFYTISHNNLPATGSGVWIGPLQENANPDTISWVSITDNTLGSFFDFNPGAEHVLVQDNVAYRTGGFAGFDIQGTYSPFDRVSSDIRILNNTVITQNCTFGTFISLYSAVNGIDVENNIWQGNILYGVNQAAAIYVCSVDFSSFSAIKNNIFPDNTGQYGGTYYYETASSSTGGTYLTQTQWQALGEIGTNDYDTLSLDQLDGYSYSIGGQTYGSRMAA